MNLSDNMTALCILMTSALITVFIISLAVHFHVVPLLIIGFIIYFLFIIHCLANTEEMDD